MSFARTGTFVGLAGLGLWLLATSPVRAEQSSSSFTGVPHLLTATAAALDVTSMGTGNVSDQCTFNGIKLAGKVKVVDSFPDVRVKAVSSFPDVKVKKVTSFASDCGEWQFVDSFADFEIQYVDSFPDVEVAWVDSFPGLP
ncbi:hypothetical protein DB30_07524 [Enhygromyxa salina]|uniref:7(1) septoil knot domain-containing protein n=2 Tax=Enhygromyxa salina TaxID=215803 RepID=A0A0C2CRK6_9BACT|nr:hypothetical protein [Enhygromyxa salina]KIG13811.1 hypothetical protein DB30_07524 [Enhygromyxa salina]